MNYKFTSVLFCLLLICGWSIGQEPTARKTKKKHLELEFSIKAGHYTEPVLLELYSPGAKIFYTLDGNEANGYSLRYEGAISINKTTTVRAIAYRGKKKSKVKTETYFIREPQSSFPVISIAIPPEELFDPDDGIFVDGDVQDSTWKKQDANFWTRVETEANFEFFETDGKPEFNSMTGFRLFGGMSRLFPQKSMAIVARDKLGKKRIKHHIFGKNGPNKFKFLVLRNSGSDFGRAHFRDALMTSLLDDWDIEKQDYRPAHTYINGKYWGIYNIREKVNRYFINSYHNIDKDSIDLIEHRLSLKMGEKDHYINMLKFIEEHNLKDHDNYSRLNTMMEIDNFIDYQIAQVYFHNRDAGGNIKFWRPQTPAGRWRWIIYDTDWGMGLHDGEAYRRNSLEFYTEADGPSWPNPPWSTFIFRNLLKNKNFRKSFINRFADHLNENFESSRVVAKISQFQRELKPEIGRHLKRWRLSERRWKMHAERMREFALKRPDYIRMHIQEFFDAGEIIDVTIQGNVGGKVILNDNISIKNEQFNGKYFERVPVKVRAMPDFGYRFSHWMYEGREISSAEFKLRLKNKETVELKAVFDKSVHVLAGKIMINEISCNNRETGDWIEIYNKSEEEVNLTDWYFSDKKKYFKIPYLNIKPDGYAVLCEDTAVFRKVFPNVENIVGNIGFGLNKRKETLGLFSAEGASIDSISYVVEPMDTFFTMSLLLPRLDNANQENWEVNIGNGSPMIANPFYLESRIKAEQDIWIRLGIGTGIFLCAFFALKMRDRKQETMY